MTGRPLIVVAELRIVTDSTPPRATLTCHLCRMAPYTVRGRVQVRDFVRSSPLLEHRVNCPAVTTRMGHAA